MKLRSAIFLAAFMFSPAVFAATPEIETFTLSNGMEVIVIPNHRVPAISHMIWYRVGGADDPRGKSGLAHYHEHMMFEGTNKLKPGDYADIISAHGGQHNAFTAHDATAYYVNISKSELPLIMDLEADRMRGIHPTDEGSAKEKQVIIEERRQRIENNPEALLEEQLNASLFRNHPYHWSVMGWMNEMEGLTKDDVLKFHQTWYHPNNAILIVSGDITAAELRPLAQKYYGNLPHVAVPPRHWTAEPPQIDERRVVMHHINVKQPEWTRNYMTPSLGYGKKDEALPLFLLSQVLGGGKTSLLYESLVVQQKLASSVDVDYDGFTLGPAEFSISITPEKDVDLETLEKALNASLQKIGADGIGDSDLARAKVLLKAESTFDRDGLSGIARIMGWIRILDLDKDYFTHWPDKIDAVTLAQVNTAMRHALKPEQSVTGWLLPKDMPASAPEAKPEEPQQEEHRGGKHEPQK